MKCATCGSELERDARFCHICGQPAPPAQEERRHCPKCGARLPALAVFCPQCGTALAVPPPATPASAPVSKTPASAVKSAPAEGTAPAAKKKKSKSKSSNAGGFALVFLILLLIAGCICAYVYVEAYTRGVSLGEYVSSLDPRTKEEAPARWSDLKTEATAAPAETSETQYGVVTKDICKAYLALLEERRARIERYDWQQSGDAPTRQVVLCDICGDNVPELIWVEATDEANVAASTLNIAAIRGGAAEILCSSRWDVQAGGGFPYYLFQEKDGKTLYAYSAHGEGNWTQCYHVFTDSGAGLEQEELLKSVMTQEFDGETSRESYSFTLRGAEISAEEWLAEDERLAANTQCVLMYNDDARSYVEGFVKDNGCPAMSCAEAEAFLSECLSAFS